MRLFRKRKSLETNGKLTDHIAYYVENRQRRLANWLNGKAKHVSKQSVLSGLIIFCALVASYLLYIMFSAFS